MPTDLLDLPGYPGHDQVQVFADDCLLGVSDDTRADPVALRAELNRRVALLSEDQVESLAALSPQTRACASDGFHPGLRHASWLETNASGPFGPTQCK